MNGRLDKFYVDTDALHGPKLMCVSHQLSAGCLSDGEVDTYIEALKADLDDCRNAMKRAIAKRSMQPAFTK